MTHSTHVIILAQGNQRRLGVAAKHPKCLFPLEHCGGRPILYRTLVQVWKLLDGVGINEDGNGNWHRATVVGWYEVKKWLDINPVFVWPPHSDRIARHSAQFVPEVESLADPGNSSLKGIARYLDTGRARQYASWPERTIVLLADVVYSWRCLEVLFAETKHTVCFAGTNNLGPGDGELWGIQWDRSADRLMMMCLRRALEKHPRFEEYQPGQLRNWLWQVDEVSRSGDRGWFTAVDDYTMDVDLPEHIPLLGPASSAAADDDLRHGVHW